MFAKTPLTLFIFKNWEKVGYPDPLHSFFNVKHLFWYARYGHNSLMIAAVHTTTDANLHTLQ